MCSKGKIFRATNLCTSPTSLCSSDSDNDREVDEIFSQSQTESRGRGIFKENKKRRENLHAVIAKPKDEGVEKTLIGNRTTESVKRSADDEEVDDSFKENKKRRETPPHAFVTEPANEPTEWSREQVKKWVSSLFGDNVGDRFYEEEIDGRALMESKRLEEDKVLERLGISTIGKKERFERELRAIRPEMNPLSQGTFSATRKIDASSFRHFDRLLSRQEREHLSCKDKSIYNTKKRKITKEVEKRWPRNTVLPNYRNKEEALEVDKFVEKIVEDETMLYPECGLQKAAVFEIVLKKLREQRRLQKNIPVSQDEIIMSTDSASESSSSGTPTPPLSQLATRVEKYNLYFDDDLTQNSADLMVMAVLKKPSIKDVKMNHLHKLRKMFNLSLLRGKDKYTHVRAVANSLYSEGYIKIAEEANLASLTRDDISVVKTLDLED